MKKITSFFVFCSGADSDLLSKAPTETSKYVGIGATVFFTGLFASLAATYALYTVFDNVWTSMGCGLMWGLLIFNLDRFIVSSMRKEGRFGRELLMSLPRILLAIIISIVIAKPLELKIFEKEIGSELVIMEQEAFGRQESVLKSRFQAQQDSLKAERRELTERLEAKNKWRNELALLAQQEADGTGGSRRRNLGPIYKAKKADADRAEKEYVELQREADQKMNQIDSMLDRIEGEIAREVNSLNRDRIDGPAARLEALNRVASKSDAIWLADIFVLLLFIAIETAPVLVKLLAPKGPYDNLLKIEEHAHAALEVESTAKCNSEAKARSHSMMEHEQNFVQHALDEMLKKPDRIS